MTLGSLFDGIAGFPLAAERQGIKTIWTSEIEANCTDIAKRHFPDAENLGDITKINGGNIPAVDIISFGSPCQDLSVAGEQKGLDGARSGLFMEAVRIVREMRKGNEKRKKRIKTKKASAFDIKAAAIVNDALCNSCGNIESIRARRQMQEKIYKSIVYNTPYEYIADALCGRRQFYEYRTEFITLVAQAMDMLPEQKGKEHGN